MTAQGGVLPQQIAGDPNDSKEMIIMADPKNPGPTPSAEDVNAALLAELEQERAARIEAQDALAASFEAQGDAAVVVENPTVPLDTVVWLRHSNGVAHSVQVGSEAYARLVEQGAQPIDGPTEEESEVSDFAMVEKAKADSKRR